VPFNFLRKKGPPIHPAPAPVADPTPEVIEAAHRSGGVAFDGLTEEWRLMGVMNIRGRLSDALNKREAIAIADVSWAPVDGSDPFTPVPGLKSVDPYDLIVVLAGEGTLPPLSDAEKVAHKVHKVPYDVVLEAPPFRIVGTVYMFAGTEPERLLDRGTDMFVPVTDAIAYLGDRRLGETEVDVVLVNRFYLRGIEQIDKRTGAHVPPHVPPRDSGIGLPDDN
jgi:hypothetical protein